MKVIYLAGKYRAKSEWQLTQNIRHAEAEALKLWKAGWAVICPHKNTAYFGGAIKKGEPYLWLNGDLEILGRCDAIYMLKGWRQSEGARAEYKKAKECNLEILYEGKGK